MKPRWQHVVPQRDLDHEPRPDEVRRRHDGGFLACDRCGKEIMPVGPDAGPEGLRARFPL
jgi:hypothetical protein